jgi:hypothetical protein
MLDDVERPQLAQPSVERAGLTDEQIASLSAGGPDDACWDEQDRVLIRLCDSLHDGSDVDDELWTQLRAPQFARETASG